MNKTRKKRKSKREQTRKYETQQNHHEHPMLLIIPLEWSYCPCGERNS
jgi:hypothetical protein